LHLENRRKRLERIVSGLSSTYHSYMNWLQLHAPALQNYKNQLLKSIMDLEKRRKELEEDVKKRGEEVERLRLEEENMRKARRFSQSPSSLRWQKRRKKLIE